jgi:peptidoglycan/xylan/chitin deacetylase (PgdA/CDA1 family)
MDKFIANLVSISPLSKVAHKLLGHYVTIFMLHRPTPHNNIYNGTCPELLKKCLEYAGRNNFEFATIDEVVTMAMANEKPKRPTICFTMDDGYLDQLEVLTPVLLEYDAKPTIFVLSDFSDNRDWPWDAKIIYLSQNTTVPKIDLSFNDMRLDLDFSDQAVRIKSRRILTALAKHLPDQQQDELIKLLQEKLQLTLPSLAPAEFAPADWQSLRHYHAQGLNVGAHGRTHKVFSSLTDDKVIEELTLAKTRLLAEIPDASNVFCYSSGTDADYSAKHCPMVAQADYSAAVSAKPGNTSLSAIKKDLFNIKRHSFPAKYEHFVRYASWFELIRSNLD